MEPKHTAASTPVPRAHHHHARPSLTPVLRPALSVVASALTQRPRLVSRPTRVQATQGMESALKRWPTTRPTSTAPTTVACSQADRLFLFTAAFGVTRSSWGELLSDSEAPTPEPASCSTSDTSTSAPREQARYRHRAGTHRRSRLTDAAPHH